jgi:hypothetical protein
MQRERLSRAVHWQVILLSLGYNGGLPKEAKSAGIGNCIGACRDRSEAEQSAPLTSSDDVVA